MNLPLFWLRDKPLRMVWTVTRGRQKSYMVGTAHFFPYSFARSLTGLLQKVETAVLEGPLDEVSTRQVVEYGRQDGNGTALVEMLEPAAIAEINRQLGRRLEEQVDETPYLLFRPARPNYVEMYTAGLRPWAAFFSIWSTYLNWKYSVDVEAYQIARKLDKQVFFLETIDEQLAVLDGIPLERMARHLNAVEEWPVFAERYTRAFLEGDLANFLSATERFPTRCPVVVGPRDTILFQRMKEFFEIGPAAAFVGAPHIPGVSRLFQEEGYQVSQGMT